MEDHEIVLPCGQRDLIQVIHGDVSGDGLHQLAFVRCIFVWFSANEEYPFAVDDKVTFGGFEAFVPTIVAIDGLGKQDLISLANQVFDGRLIIQSNVIFEKLSVDRKLPSFFLLVQNVCRQK